MNSMKPLLLILFLLLFSSDLAAQKRRAAPAQRNVVHTAVVMDELISVLRKEPSLYSEAIQRMRRGRKVRIVGVKDADGIRFFKVIATPPAAGWVQADAVFSERRPEDEERLAKLVQATTGFDQVEAATHFFRIYPSSKFKPAILLLFGDIVEGSAAVLSRNASRQLSTREMAASGAPLHSYYLNFNMLDRYRRLGIIFQFNSATRQYHYNGDSWKEIIEKFPAAAETVEARKRLDSLKEKLEKRTTQ